MSYDYDDDDFGSAIQTIDASAVSHALEIDGNRLDNKIIGGSGKNKIDGDKGNDTLTGGKGNDIFIYEAGDGKDVIFGFEDDDMLQITGTFSASYNRSKDEIYFKVGSTSKAVTLKNFDTSSFNVNGDIYRISGSKLIKK